MSVEGGGGCTRAREIIRRRLILDVCSCCVSGNESVCEAQRVVIVPAETCQSPVFLSNFWGSAILKMLNAETRVYRTKLV